jgi:hypothetical protein
MAATQTGAGIVYALNCEIGRLFLKMFISLKHNQL